MIKCVTMVLALALAAACSNAPAPVQEATEPFTIMGVVVDQAANSIIVNIRVYPPATEEHVKSVAEKAIARYSDQYKKVTIKSHFAGSGGDELPYATSVLENGAVTHHITPGAATRKIPTH